MAVAVTTLHKRQAAVRACKGAQAFVDSQVISQVADFGELRAALAALKHLVFSARRFVDDVHFSEALGFPDLFLLPPHVTLFWLTTDFNTNGRPIDSIRLRRVFPCFKRFRLFICRPHFLQWVSFLLLLFVFGAHDGRVGSLRLFKVFLR